MGLSMCSQQDRGSKKSYINEFQITEQWCISEEETEEDDSINFNSVNRSKSAPGDARGPVKTTTLDRTKTQGALDRTRGSSLEDRMRQWHRSSIVERKAERAAKQYTEMVQDDTLGLLRHTVRLAGSITEKGADINEELRRQELIFRKADHDISFAEYETDQTTQKLKGMTSFSGKIVGTIRKNKPKLKIQAFSDFDLMDGQIGLCSLSRSVSTQTTPAFKASPRDAKQLQIKSGMGELHAALDVITVQQMDAAWTLKRQERYLSKFDDKLDSTHTKINRQSRVITRIMTNS